MRFRELLTECGVETAPESHEHHRSGWVNFDCPWCSPGWKHYRMGFNERGFYVNCWACGRHGITETLREILGRDFSKAGRLLRDIERPAREEEPERIGKLVLPKGVGPLLKSHQHYLRVVRGFNVRSLIDLWEIKGIGLSSELQWRLFIPIIYRGSMVSWTTRSISDEHSERYVAAPIDCEALPHKDLIYGEDYCRHSIIVVEGPTDVWRIGPGSGCTFGTGFSRAQVEKIAKYPVRVVCFDNEDPAQEQARELCDLLSVFDGKTYNVTLDEKDPGSASAEEISKLRRRFLGA